MFLSRSIVVAALVSTAFVGSAYARDPVFTVKLAAPLAEQTRVIAQNTLWNCVGDTCVARPSHAATVRACRQFARESGARVLAYGSDARQLTAEELSRCNGDESTLQARN